MNQEIKQAGRDISKRHYKKDQPSVGFAILITVLVLAMLVGICYQYVSQFAVGGQ